MSNVVQGVDGCGCPIGTESVDVTTFGDWHYQYWCLRCGAVLDGGPRWS